jgi:hypothetical protein
MYYYGGYGMGLNGGSQYWMLFILIAIVPMIANMKVQSAFAKYSKVRSLSGYTGEEAARRILMMNNIGNLHIKPVAGSMTDHYNPTTKQIALSQTVYGQNTIAAISVAAHEVGHAIQDATDYSFLRMRHTLFPVTQLASKMAMPLIIAGFIFSNTLITFGIVLFAFTTLFSIVTLPVEFNASKRALVALEASGILSADELKGAREVLTAAALTYVAATVTSLLMLLRFILIYGNRRRRD